MELGNSISTLFKLSSSGNMHQPKGLMKVGLENDQPGFQRIAVHGQRSSDNHIAQLTQRMAKMASLIARITQATPALNDAPTVAVESPREGSASFSYSLTTDEFGQITESVSFKIQYKPAGESSFVEAGSVPVPVEVESGDAKPIDAEVIDSITPVVNSDENSAEPLTFEQHIAALVEYYRIATAETPVGDDTLVEVEDAVDAEGHDHGHGGSTLGDGNIINIDADYVSRIYSGGGDDVFSINADNARRIRSGGGDDTVTINSDKVARIHSGSGDDVVTIDADKVRRIHTGAGDDVLTINADKVARINMGEGDDNLTINADKITRINTGEGDDVLNLTADSIKRVNAGAGDDTLTIDAEDAAIAFGAGGGEDVINITSVGALAIQIDSALAASSDDYEVVTEGNSVKLVFSSGESLTINNVENAGMISVSIGGEVVDLHLSEAPVELDMSA